MCSFDSKNYEDELDRISPKERLLKELRSQIISIRAGLKEGEIGLIKQKNGNQPIFSRITQEKAIGERGN